MRLTRAQLTDLQLLLLASHGFEDPDRPIEIDGHWGPAAEAAQNRLNVALDSQIYPEGCHLSARSNNLETVFGAVYEQAMEGNLPKGYDAANFDSDWLRGQRRVNVMVTEGTDPASFTDAGDPTNDQLDEALERLSASATPASDGDGTDNDNDGDGDGTDDAEGTGTG